LLDYISSCRSAVEFFLSCTALEYEGIDRSFIMKRVIAGLSFAVVSALATSSAFAQGSQSIGGGGSYNSPETATQSLKTRVEVRAEIVTAYDNGSLANLNRNSYPDRSLTGDAIAAQHDRRVQEAAVAEQRNRSIVEYANGSTVQGGSTAAR
jgi:hypothetical protein